MVATQDPDEVSGLANRITITNDDPLKIRPLQ